MKETWFEGKRLKSPLLPLYERGKSSHVLPFVKGRQRGFYIVFEPSFFEVTGE
jgi:hypothetical protein